MRTNSESQEVNGALDKVKWILVIILAAFVVWGNFYFSEPNPIYQPNVFVRIIGVIVLSVLTLLLMATTRKGKNFIGFSKESRTELRKVVWPTRKETVQTTLLIAVITTIVGLFLWGLDSIFSWVVLYLTSVGH